MAIVPATSAAEEQADERLTPRSLATLIACAAMMMIEGYDLAAMPLAVPLVSDAWQLAPENFAVALSAIVLGIGIAAVTLAPLGDRVDRRNMILGTAAIVTLATFGTATATSVSELFAWRLLNGLALGACLPNITAMVARIAPGRIRARALTLVSTAIPIGAVLAALLASPLATFGSWQFIFTAAGLVTLVVTGVMWFLLSSAEMRGRLANREVDRSAASAVVTDRDSKADLAFPVFALLRRAYLPSTIVFLGLATTNTFLVYMLISWLPTVLPMSGITVAEAARLSSLVQGGGIIGSLIYAYFLDRKRAIKALATGYVMAIGALLILAGGQLDTLPLAAMLLVVGTSISGAHTAIMILGMSFYPAHMLSSAVGLKIAVTRSGAVLGPLAGGWVIAAAPGIGPFMLVAAIPAVLAVLWVLAVPVVRGTWRI